MSKEAVITIVGFLGAGKTTLLKFLTKAYLDDGIEPFVILNDYENAHIDAHQISSHIEPKSIRALSGSCICCSGIHQLRDFINQIPKRTNGVTLIEANGTTDATSLAGVLGVGLEKRFLPPVQISVVNAQEWQKRGEHNELEANQIQLSSLIVLSHVEDITAVRKDEVVEDIRTKNPKAQIINMKELDARSLLKLLPSKNIAQKMDHYKSHWSSCSVDLPELPSVDSIHRLCSNIPKSILRVKGCVKVNGALSYTYFERTPDRNVTIRPFNGVPPMGAKLLTIGIGSEESILHESINKICCN